MKTVESRQKVEKTITADAEDEETERKSVAELVKSKESVLVHEAKSKQSTVTKAETTGRATVETNVRRLSQSGESKLSTRSVAESIKTKQKSVTESKSHYPADANPQSILRLRSITDAISKSNESNLLQAPENTDDPTSPCVEDGHIIFPGQTQKTRNRVQHYAQTLNAMLNRKSIVIEEDDEIEADDKFGSNRSAGGVQKSKSGTLLFVPKQYESAIKKSEVGEKERTVAAYFAASKMSQSSLQRSSSQHSVLSSSSMKSFGRHDDKSSTASPQHVESDAKVNVTDAKEHVAENQHHSESTTTTTSSSTTTTTSKSAHHLKILRKQQQKLGSPLAKSQTLPSINLLDETNVDDAFEEIFASFGK